MGLFTLHNCCVACSLNIFSYLCILYSKLAAKTYNTTRKNPPKKTADNQTNRENLNNMTKFEFFLQYFACSDIRKPRFKFPFCSASISTLRPPYRPSIRLASYHSLEHSRTGVNGAWCWETGCWTSCCIIRLLRTPRDRV